MRPRNSGRVRELHQLRAGLAVLRTELVPALVVAPHERELHLAAVGRLEEALLQRLLLRDLAVVPVVIVEEHVDAGVRGELDLRGDVRRVLAVQIAWQRLDRHLVAGEARLRRAGELPFGPARVEPLVPLRIDAPVGVVDRHHFDFLRRVRPRRTRGQQTSQSQESSTQSCFHGEEYSISPAYPASRTALDK